MERMLFSPKDTASVRVISLAIGYAWCFCFDGSVRITIIPAALLIGLWSLIQVVQPGRYC
jgi:hypothetical protein